jgi:hypothetical protein
MEPELRSDVPLVFFPDVVPGTDYDAMIEMYDALFYAVTVSEGSDVSSASECAKVILSRHFGHANPFGTTSGGQPPMSVIGLKQ